MSDLVLYTNPMSRGRIARWMLEETGVRYETVVLEYGPKGMATDEYGRINPMRKVPAIVHGDEVVTEAAAICLYLADAFPAAGLAPEPSERGQYYRWVLFAAGPLEQAITNATMGWHVPDDPQKRGMLGYGSFDRAVDALDGMLQRRRFVCGDAFTAADVYVGAQVDWGLQFKTLPARESFAAYAGRLRERPAYVKAKAVDEALAAGSAHGGAS